jgi:glycosyltransferase involved in cell wall biosynthesis
MIDDARIAVLTPYGPTARQAGGVEIFNDSLRRALGNVEIFADARPPERPWFGDLRRVGLDQPVGAVRAARSLLRAHRRDPYDLILSNGLSGWPLTLAKPGVPMVEVYHFTMAGLARQALPLRGDRVTTGRVAALFDRLAGMGKHVVAVSPRVLKEVESFYGLHGRFIPNAVDTTKFRPMNPTVARRVLGLPLGARIGIFVGRPDSTKGFDVLLRVARLMPGVLFLVVGAEGPSGGNVRYLGRIGHEEMPRWYSASDFFFLPSRYEGFNLSLLEALSCNIPAVVSAASCPFPDEPVRCGLVVHGMREQDFADAIRVALSAKYEFAPRQFIVPRFNVDVFERTWRGFIQSVLDRDGRGSPRRGPHAGEARTSSL